MLNLIVAMNENYGIGYKNTLPWHLPQDLKHFKEVTMGHPVIMGRKTFESIGKNLEGRTNVVISSQSKEKLRLKYLTETYSELANISEPEKGNLTEVMRQKRLSALSKCILVNSLQAAIDATKEYEQSFIIGGSSIYRESLPLVQRMYITHIINEIWEYKCDSFFPKFLMSEWQEIESQSFQAINRIPAHCFSIYERIPKES